jgi:4-amino-4-deoxy-L-arabinose transferase-like glycosyltransferase
MRRKFIWGALIGIILLATFVRVFNLSSVPPSPYLDEASNGYNAYSLMLTGKDEYAKPFPLLMQAYNDYRPTLFVYLMIPFIKVLGLTLFAIRLPAVILTVLATVAIFFLTRELFTLLDKKKPTVGTTVGLLAALLYAISPWSIYSSRTSNEINMSLSFFIYALALFLYAINRKLKALPFFFSVACFVIAFYAYHGIKLFLPFFILGLVILFFKNFLKQKKVALGGLILGIIFFIPLIFAFSNSATTSRLGGVITQDETITAESARRVLYDKNHNNYIGALFDNRRVLMSLEFANNYLRNFDPTWLFLQQRNKTFPVPDFGPFYLFGLPLLMFGFYFLTTTPLISKRIKILVFLWIFASVIPAAVSSESPHLNRPNTLLPGLIVMQAMGLYWLIIVLSRLKNQFLRNGAYVSFVLIIAVSFIWFLHAYFVNFPYKHSQVFQYGVIQALQYAKEHENAYQKIIISNGHTLLNGYAYYLFTNRYDPAYYQRQGGTKSAFFTDTHLIGKYDFRDPNLYEPTNQTQQPLKILYITNPGELNEKIVKNERISVLQKIYFLDGTDSLWIQEGTLQ